MSEATMMASKHGNAVVSGSSADEGSTSAPLSFPQQRLWFLQQFEPNSTAYNLPRAFRLRGPLNDKALQAALAALIDRHDMLRTRFEFRDGQPCQVVERIAPFSLQREPAPQQSHGWLQARIRAEAAQPFDLAVAPLIRATLLVLDEEHHVLLLTLHHIASDAGSNPTLMRDLATLYRAACTGEAARLPAPNTSYAQLAVEQRERQQRGEFAASLEHWRNYVGMEVTPLSMPADRPRSPSTRSRGSGVHVFSLPSTALPPAQVLCRQERMTPFVPLLAAWQVLLSRCSGQREFTVGVPNAARTREELQSIVGCFVNTQIYCARIDTSSSARQICQTLRGEWLAALAHADFPFELLLDELKPARDATANPLFQVMFNLRSAEEVRRIELPGLAIELLAIETASAKCELALDVTVGADGVACRLEYDDALFLPATVQRLGEHYAHTVEQLVLWPDRPIRELRLIPEPELQRLMSFAAPVPPSPDALPPLTFSIVSCIEHQAQATPHATALIFEDRQLSYSQLNAKANQLARHLRGQGVGPEVIVGVACERSIEMVLALLAILKAGGAYLPLDPGYPPERLSYMLRDSQVRLVLTHDAVPREWFNGVSLVHVDARGVFDECSEDGLPLEVTGENAAYCIYTSGSTGRPKAVINTHQGLGNRLAWMQAEYGLDGSDRVLQKTPFSFDVSVWEFFWPLMSGATLVVAAPGAHRDPLQLRELITRHGITTLHFVPSMLQAFINAGELPACTSLGRVFCSGEALSLELQRQFNQQHQAALHNLYGPTEAAIDVTCWACREEVEPASVPIGRPITRTCAYVLDEDLQPVPIGAPGELYLGGIGLARGYHLRPGLTAERFIPHPLTAASSERLYRTGDLARWRADGVIEYLGRLDAQVKIRGFRIEPGEIEAALRAQPGVLDAAVVTRDVAGGRQLVAYVVGSTAQHSSDTCADALRATLPEYMVPSAFVILDALPLTPSGKLDRKALPEPQWTQRNSNAAPRTDIECALTEIWCKVLNHPTLGIEENFFERGGDSIIAIDVVSRARARGIELRPVDLFQHQTIAALARVARWQREKTAGALPQDAEIPLTPIQRWFFETTVPERHHWNQAVLLVPSATPDPVILEKALQVLCLHHGALRLRFTESEEEWRQRYGTSAESSLLMCAHLEPGVDAADGIESMMAQVQSSLDIARGPLLRAALMMLGEGRGQRLLIAIHHLAVDGVSWRILLEDLQVLYQQIESGKSPALAAATGSFASWSGALVRYASSARLLQQLPYWQNAVAASHSSLPAEDANGCNQVATAHTLTASLDAAETQSLLTGVPAAVRMQASEILLTALAHTLCEWSKQDGVLIELEGHGREDLFDDVDVTRTVGWFTSRFPVYLCPVFDNATRSLLAVKEQLRAVPDRGLGYGVLRYLTPAGRILGDHVTPQVAFNYLGRFRTGSSTWMTLAPEPVTHLQSASAERRNWLEISAAVHDRLSIRWAYSRAIHATGEMQQLLDHFVATVRTLCAHCLSESTAGATPSDFPLATLTQQALDGLPCQSHNIEDIYPLAPLQHGMLFHSRHAVRDVYVMQLRVILRHPDVNRLRAAWQAAIRRHAILRTGFHWANKQPAPLQVVLRQADLPFEQCDLDPSAGVDETLDKLCEAERARGFNLAAPPLMRVVLLRLQAGEQCMVWTFHHLILDGWSVTRLLAEVLQHYEGRALAATTGSYRDYIAWLAHRDQGVDERFWRAQTAALQEPTLLSAATGTAASAAGHDVIEFEWTDQRSARLQAFARSQRITLNTLIQGAWALLLRRCTDRDTVVFGAVMSGRPAELPDSARSVGLFINTLPIVVELSSRTRVNEWLQDLQALNAGLREHGHAPLHEIQRWAGYAGQLLFDTVLVFENYPIEAALHEQRSLSYRDVRHAEHTSYPLAVIVTLGQRLRVQFNYARAYFDATRIRSLSGYLTDILEQLIAQPQCRLARIALRAARDAPIQDGSILRISAGESRAVEGSNVIELFTRQVQCTPDAIAVEGDGIKLRYCELDCLGDALAQRLSEVAARRVAICMPHSVERVIAVLGVLKAGAAYVPVDPQLPEQRLAYMLADADVQLVLTLGPMELPQACTGATLSLDGMLNWQGPAADRPIHPGQLAYIMHTSGSTGRPKGVAMRHGAAAQLLQWHRARWPGGYRTLQFAAFGFDVSFQEIFSTWTSGGTLLIADSDARGDLQRLARFIEARAVERLFLPFAVLQPLAEIATALGFRCGSLRQIISAGEALHLTPALREWLGCMPRCVLVNQYGPTETHVVSDFEAVPDGTGAVPIGRPIWNTRLYVLDADLNLLPAGQPGDLYIAGQALAQGYWAKSGQTAERFVPDCFSGDGGRMYRSGDRACYDEQGRLHFLGRRDDQVKLRGFRIELGEIEAALADQPGVSHAAVVVRGQGAGRHILAYFVGEAATADRLRETLRQRLPDYMVPMHFIALPKMPLTANGKLDRRALPEPVELQQSTYTAPRTRTEAALAHAWQEVLGLERIGVDDHFFEIGGHSLAAVQVQIESHALLPGGLSVADIFKHPTIAALAAHIDEHAAGARQQEQRDLENMQSLLESLEP